MKVNMVLEKELKILHLYLWEIGKYLKDSEPEFDYLNSNAHPHSDKLHLTRPHLFQQGHLLKLPLCMGQAFKPRVYRGQFYSNHQKQEVFKGLLSAYHIEVA